MQKVLLASAAAAVQAAKPWADGRWYDASPYFNLPVAICKRLPHCVLDGSCQRGEGECPQTWQSFQGYCYLLIRHHLVFAEAAERCKESQYVQPTEGTNNFVKQLCGRQFCWLGFQEFPNTESWRWLDESDSGYDAYYNWAEGEPNNFDGHDESDAWLSEPSHRRWQNVNEKLPEIWADGLWYDLPESFSLGQAICKSEGECKDDWRSFRGFCYQLLKWPGTFKEAEGRCEEVSAHLVSIGSGEEQDFVQQLCGENMCWLGLEESPESEHWHWIDGSPLSFEHWQQGEPNNFAGVDENRAIMNLNLRQDEGSSGVGSKMMRFRSQRTSAWQRMNNRQQDPLAGAVSWADGRWYDVPITFNLALPLCQAASSAQECEPGWKAFKDSCYKLIFHLSDFNTASQRCLEHNSLLVTVEDGTTNQFLRELCGNHFCWLGLRRHQGSAVWSWTEPWPALPGVGEPNNFNSHAAEKVAIMNFNPLNWASGRWYDVRGSLKLPKAICEKKKTAGVCDTGWSARENSCYLKLTWHYDFETAMLRCEDMGADLVSIGTLKEQIFVQHLCGQQMCWLGLLEHPQSEYWFWIDGTPMAYQNWQTGEPNNGKGDENRAVMNMNLNFEETVIHQEAREDHIAVALACGCLLLVVILLGRGALMHGALRRSHSNFDAREDDDAGLLEYEEGDARCPPLREPDPAEFKDRSIAEKIFSQKAELSCPVEWYEPPREIRDAEDAPEGLPDAGFGAETQDVGRAPAAETPPAETPPEEMPPVEPPASAPAPVPVEATSEAIAEPEKKEEALATAGTAHKGADWGDEAKPDGESTT
eukprot:g19355.t1